MHFASLIVLTTTLVLRSGDRITLDTAPVEQNGVVVFRSGGALYSIPATEIDATATAAANDAAPAPTAPRRLKVTAAERDRLLKELQDNHMGRPATEQRWQSEPAPPIPDRTGEEWQWRREARSYEESIRRANENRDMLLDRIDQLQDQIRGFLILGYKPEAFTYQTTQLAYAQEQVPSAELEVKRAQRLYEQFREDARRQGVLPGWLR